VEGKHPAISQLNGTTRTNRPHLLRQTQTGGEKIYQAVDGVMVQIESVRLHSLKKKPGGAPPPPPPPGRA